MVIKEVFLTKEKIYDSYMDRTWPNSNMSIYNIDNDSNTIEIKRSHHFYYCYVLLIETKNQGRYHENT